MAQVVFTNTAEGVSTRGALFEGQKFWLSATVPGRGTIREYILSNGGSIVPIENDADIKLVDHLKKIQPQGSYSYRYVESSVRKGRLENLEDHRCGPVEHIPRPAGSIARPGRGFRTPFTLADDKVLLQWVANNPQKGSDAGIELYRQLESHNPRHTWQSWRDRYVKRFRGMALPPPQSTSAQHQVPRTTNAPPTPPNDQTEHHVTDTSSPRPPARRQPASLTAIRNSLARRQTGLGARLRREQAEARPTELQEDSEDGPQRSQYEEIELQEDSEDVPQRSQYEEIEYQEGMSFTKDDEESLLSFGKFIYNLDPAQADAAWEQFAASVGTHHTAQEWRTYWEEAIKPIYLEQKRQRRVAGETSSRDDDSDHRTDLERSPSYDPGSPVYNAGDQNSISVDARADIEEFLDLDGDIDTPPVAQSDQEEFSVSPPEVLAKASQEPELHKRKRSVSVDDEDIVPHSSPLKSLQTSRRAKRPRNHARPTGDSDSEIPYSSKSDDEEDEKASQSIEEEEIFVPRGASPTLSEPDYNYQSRIDAQIFGEIMSSLGPRKSPSIKVEDDSSTEKESEFLGRNEVWHSEPIVTDASETGKHLQNGRYEVNDEESDAAPVSYQPQRNSLELGHKDEVRRGQFPEAGETRVYVDSTLHRSYRPYQHRRTSPQDSRFQGPQSSPSHGLLPAAEITSQKTREATALPGDEEPPVHNTGFVEANTDEMQAWVAQRLAEDITFEDLEVAVRCTSMVLQLADQALTSILRGEGIPNDIPGIWTEKDDADRFSFENQRLLRVMRKHGATRYEARKKWLQEYDNDN